MQNIDSKNGLRNIRVPSPEVVEKLEQLLYPTKKEAQNKAPLGVTALSLYEQLMLDPEMQYRIDEIPKGNGKTRTIEAPSGMLKYYQHLILRVLNYNRMPDGVYGFTRGRSAYTGIARMTGLIDKNREDLAAVYSTDIQDFFPSVKENEVYGAVLKYLVRILHKWPGGPQLSVEVVEDLANFITQLCCINGRLPQGAPTSPMLANMVAKDFDRIIKDKLPASQIYGRYADDIVIMGTEALSKKDRKVIESILAEFGFKIHPKKTTNQVDENHYKIWGVNVIPKKVSGRERIIFRLPRKLEEQWAKEMFEFINDKNLPSNRRDLMNDRRFQVIMGRLAHAHRVYKLGEADQDESILLPSKLKHAWKVLCNKFDHCLPSFEEGYFTTARKTVISRQTETVAMELDLESFKKRVKKFLEINQIEESEFAVVRKEEQTVIVGLNSKEDLDESVDVAIAKRLEAMSEGLEDLETEERKQQILRVLAAAVVLVEQMLIAGKNFEEGDVDKEIHRIGDLRSDLKSKSLLPEELSSFWKEFAEELYDDEIEDLKAFKYLFSSKHSVKLPVSVAKETVLTKQKITKYVYLPGFKYS